MSPRPRLFSSGIWRTTESEGEENLALDHPNALPLKGWANVARPYERCGIHGWPKIMIPGNTRMIVYSSAFLRQSFRHFPARYQAMVELSRTLCLRAEDPASKNRAAFRKRADTVIRVGLRMTKATNVLPAFLVHVCFVQSASCS